VRQISNSSPSVKAGVNHKARTGGFTIIETLLAIVIFLTFAGIATYSLTQGLRGKRSQQTYLELQQNLRTALQQITQDIRLSSKVGPWNEPTTGCSHPNDACSLSNKIALLVTTGRYTAIAEPPGSSYNNSVETGVCDATGFRTGDMVLIDNSGSFDIVKLTGVQRQRNKSQPCSSGPTPNRDKLQHNNDKISGTWQPNSYAYNIQIVTYRLMQDPIDRNRKVLYRRTGLNGRPGPYSGIVAFDVDSIKFSYGVPVNPSAANTSIQKLRFFNNLSQAAAALGSGYTDNPRGSGTYVGRLVRAIRVTLTGTTPKPLRTGGARGKYEVNETVDLR